MNPHSLQRRILLNLLGLALAGSALAGPRILMSPSSLDLGDMEQNQVREVAVTLSNAGDQDLEISEIFSECPCTLPTLESDLLAPGQSTQLRVSFHSDDMQGEVHKLIEVYSNDPENSFLELHISVEVLAPVWVEPADRKLDFGEVPAAGATLAASFRAEGLESLELSLDEYDAHRFGCEILPGEDGQTRLEVCVLPGAEAGPFKEIIRLGTNAPGAPVIDLEAFGTVTAALVAEPALLNFRFVKPGDELLREIRVLDSSGELDFQVTGAEIDLPGLEAEVKGSLVHLSGAALGADHPLARSTRGRLKGELRIFTDHPAQPELKVKVMYMMRI